MWLRIGSSTSKAEELQGDSCCLGFVFSYLVFQGAVLKILGYASIPLPLPPVCTHQASAGTLVLSCRRAHTLQPA